MSDSIFVGYDDKLRRLTFKAPFWANEVMREFPSRRFDPKSKSWHVPLTVQNVKHMTENSHKYDFQIGLLAQQAIENLKALTSGPVYHDFPAEYFVEQPFPPLEHQWRMLNYGWNLNSYALIAAMGTGKTFVSIALAMARWKMCGLKALVIVSPKNLHNTWRKEFKKWYFNDEHYMIHRVESGKMKQLEDWIADEPKRLHVLLVGVEGLGVSEKYADTIRHFYLKMPGQKIMSLVDESSRIKNEKAKRTNVVIEFGKPISEWRMILNGTPTSKSLGDLWPQFEFLDPNIIGSGDYWAYRTRYLVYGGYEGKQLVGYQRTEELMDLIRPYTLEVDKSVLNLPPKMYKEIVVTPTNEQKAMIKQIVKGKGPYPRIKVQNVLERDLRIQQVIGGHQPVTVSFTKGDEIHESTELVPLEENPKFDTLVTLIEENVATSKFVIWSRFVPELEMIIKMLKEKYGPSSTLGYYGAVEEADRIVAEDRYCNDPTARFFVANPAAAGLGLTLISGENDVMVYYSGTFAYIDRSQSEDRCHRIGQKNTCLVIDLIMENTLDTTIQESIREKSDLDKYIKRRVREGKNVDELLEGNVT